MEKISLQKKSFFNSIGLDVNNIPSELKLKANAIQVKMPTEIVDYLDTEGLAKVEQKYFCLKNLFGTCNEDYDNKNWLEIFDSSNKSDEIVKLYFRNPNYFFQDLRKIDKSNTSGIELYEDGGKFYIKDGISRLSLMMVKYLLEMSRATSKEERLLINKQYVFSANVKSTPKDTEIVYLISMLTRIYGSKMNITGSYSDEDFKYTIEINGKKITVKDKNELETFVKNSFLPKECKSEARLKSKIENLAKIGLDFEDGDESEELYIAMGNLFPNYETFIKYYEKLNKLEVEDDFYSSLDISNVSYDSVLSKLIKIVKQNSSVKVEQSKANNKETTKDVIANKKSIEKNNEKEKAAKIKEDSKEVKLKEDESKPELLRKKIDDKMVSITNNVEMMYYKFKTEESNLFELANESKVALNIDRISDDAVNSSLNSIKSNYIQLKSKISEEEDIEKLNSINDYVGDLNDLGISKNVLNEYVDEMNRIYGSCLNKHTQQVITDSKLNKLDLQREEIENEKCSFFSKIIGKAKLKQAKLDNINLKKQLILSESQFADKLHYYIEDGLSDLYAYTKNEEDERCLVEAKSYIRMIESNMKIQNMIDNNKLNKLIKEKVAQKRNLPQLALSKEKRKLFSKAQINLMQEKNNELKRVIQITRANSLKQQNTGMIPVLGNIKTTKAFNKFCTDINRIDSSIRSLI